MRGHGLGSWFSGIFRAALPYLSRGARAVGKEALRAGVGILDDIGESNIPFNESLHNRMHESSQNLKRSARTKISELMQGSGYKNASRKRRIQSVCGASLKRIGKKKNTKKRKAVKKQKVKTRKVQKKTVKRRNKKLNDKKKRPTRKLKDIFD